MNKRVFTLITAMIMALLMVFTVAAAEDDTPSDSAGYYYVYTENGKGLNVRATPGGEVVGSLKYGTKIYCYYRDGGNGWALIDYTYDMPGVGKGTYACFISSRYLRNLLFRSGGTGRSDRGDQCRVQKREEGGTFRDNGTAFPGQRMGEYALGAEQAGRGYGDLQGE